MSSGALETAQDALIARAPVFADVMSAEKPHEAKDEGDKFKPPIACKKVLTYEKAEAFYGIRLQLPADAVMREAANSMVAMWQAAHNTDYYITKYGTKALEQLQNLIGQFAIGLRRLEVQEQQEIEEQHRATSVVPTRYTFI